MIACSRKSLITLRKIKLRVLITAMIIAVITMGVTFYYPHIISDKLLSGIMTYVMISIVISSLLSSYIEQKEELEISEKNEES